MKRLLFTLVIALTAVAASAQRSVSGRVSDSATGEALIGATITLKGGNAGAITDTDGNFNITVPNDQSILQVSYTGYEMAEVAVGAQSRVDVVMKASSTLVDEVVVIGYGKQIKSTPAILPKSAAKISNPCPLYRSSKRCKARPPGYLWKV
jgi:hypothetical protein